MEISNVLDVHFSFLLFCFSISSSIFHFRSRFITEIIIDGELLYLLLKVCKSSWNCIDFDFISEIFLCTFRKKIVYKSMASFCVINYNLFICMREKGNRETAYDLHCQCFFAASIGDENSTNWWWINRFFLLLRKKIDKSNLIFMTFI